MDLRRYAGMARNIDLFHGLDVEDVAKIFAKGTTQSVRKGETVFYEGTTGSQMYVVLGGKLGVYDKDELLATLTLGDLLGEMAVVSEEPRSATVKALEDSMLFAMSESTFGRLMTKRVAVRMLLNIIRVLCRRLRTANKTIKEMRASQ